MGSLSHTCTLVTRVHLVLQSFFVGLGKKEKKKIARENNWELKKAEHKEILEKIILRKAKCMSFWAKSYLWKGLWTTSQNVLPCSLMPAWCLQENKTLHIYMKNCFFLLIEKNCKTCNSVSNQSILKSKWSIFNLIACLSDKPWTLRTSSQCHTGNIRDIPH